MSRECAAQTFFYDFGNLGVMLSAPLRFLPRTMIRPLARFIALMVAALPVGAAESATKPDMAMAVRTLAELEALPQPAANSPDYWPWSLQTTEQAFRLIESGRLATADEFFRLARLVLSADNEFRSNRTRYELLLSAAALDHAEAAQQLAAAWDRVLHALGRPLRTDFAGLQQKHPEFYLGDPAPGCVRDLLRDPAKARDTAKTAARNEEMKNIVDADQADRRRDWSKLSADEHKAMGERDHARNRRAREIIAAGELHTAADFADAALVMQHSVGFTGYQTAHELAVCAMLLGDRSRGRWLIAATYDRLLGSVGHDQRFGTQFRGLGGVNTLMRVDEAGLCDAEREALGCPTLEQARGRQATPATAAGDAKLVAEFAGPNHTVRDPLFGLTAAYPEDWKVNDVKRWGDRQNTIFFEITSDPEPSPNFYYRVYHAPKPMTPDALAEFVREEARKKQEARRDQYADYTNRAEGVRVFNVGEYPAFSWLADFTSPSGDKWAEYFVRFQTDAADASFFLQAPRNQIEKLRPTVDRFMAGLKMPKLNQP